MGRKILVVDDEQILVDTIAYNLQQAGYQVTTAADGASALEAAHRETPDLVILDIMLPEMDGLEVCRLLRRENNTATVPIMMLTAKGDEIDKVVGLEGTPSANGHASPVEATRSIIEGSATSRPADDPEPKA